ncbi:MAG: glycoside hydrolase family 3 N-terminal domain-containing protein [Pseudomonadota bacterium]|nr:glycoside hydrolase family 3 N-terminal domain-containing protein [Pseudomonadota bacterium]
MKKVLLNKVIAVTVSIAFSGFIWFLLPATATQPWIIMDLKGLTLSKQEEWMLKHPSVAGVILTLANSYGNPSIGGKKYPSLESVRQLVASIRHIRPSLLICIDYEGGYISRIEDKKLPQIPLLSERLQSVTEQNRRAVSFQQGQQTGRILKSLDIDVLLGPVLDISVAGHPLEKRAIASSPDLVAQYGSAYAEGVISEGITTAIKHFPGLGYTQEDTHHAQAFDTRSSQEIFGSMQPFTSLINRGTKMIMPSHAIYPAIDNTPATYSAKWHQILRQDLGFKGKIITDDTSMGGLDKRNLSFAEHIESIHQAGNDFVLIMHKQDKLYSYLKKT